MDSLLRWGAGILASNSHIVLLIHGLYSLV